MLECNELTTAFFVHCSGEECHSLKAAVLVPRNLLWSQINISWYANTRRHAGELQHQAKLNDIQQDTNGNKQSGGAELMAENQKEKFGR